MLAPFTSNNDVRALLGVSSEELPDSVLDLPVYQIALRRRLQQLTDTADVSALFLSIDSQPAAGRPADDQALHEAVYYFSSVAAALQAGVSLALVAPKRITDDKSGVERFTDSPYRDVLDRLDAELAAAKGAVLTALEVLLAVALPPAALEVKLFAGVRRAYDPVTGA